MGLFGSDTFKETNIFGQEATRDLQPGLFNAFSSLFGSGGVPFMGELGGQIDAAYARAAQEAGLLAPGAAGASLAANVGQQGGIAGELLKGQVGVQGQQNLLDASGIAGGYLNALTAARPQYSFDPSTQFGDIMGGISTLMEPAAIGMAVLQGRPDALAGVANAGATMPVAQAPSGGGFINQGAFNPNNFSLF